MQIYTLTSDKKIHIFGHFHHSFSFFLPLNFFWLFPKHFIGLSEVRDHVSELCKMCPLCIVAFPSCKSVRICVFVSILLPLPPCPNPTTTPCPNPIECSTFSPPATVILLILLCFEGLLFLIFTSVMFGTQVHSICTDETVGGTLLLILPLKSWILGG